MNNETVKLTVNTENLIKNTLRSAFSGKQSVLTELAQNARRAGATKFEIMYLKDVGAITVIDDGSGLDDMNKLLSVSESGWDEDVVASEAPFGVGFLSAIYKADQVKVCSKGKMLCASSEDILSFNEIEIVDVEDNGLTTVTLTGGEIEALILEKEEGEFINRLNRLFAGFPIPVLVNGQPLDQYHSLLSENNNDWVRIPEGEILQRAKYSDEHGITFHGSWVAYFQGFQIANSDDFNRRSFTAHDTASVIHLDGQHFQAIAPDRHCLIDHNRAVYKIQALFVAERERLMKECCFGDLLDSKNVNREKVILKSYDEVHRYDCLKVYNTIEALPSETLAHFGNERGDDFPKLDDNYGYGDNNIEYFEPRGCSFVKKDDITQGLISVFSEAPNLDQDHSFAYAMFIYKKGNVAGWLAKELDAGHWIHQYTHDPYDDDRADTFKVEFENLRRPQSAQNDNGADAVVLLCDSYTITSPCGMSVVDNKYDGFCHVGVIDIPGEEPAEMRALIVPMYEHGGEALEQTNTYFYNEELHEDQRDAEVSTFVQWLKNERIGDDTETLLMELLKDHTRFPSLKNSSFTVEFKDGEVSVTDMAA